MEDRVKNTFPNYREDEYFGGTKKLCKVERFGDVLQAIEILPSSTWTYYFYGDYAAGEYDLNDAKTIADLDKNKRKFDNVLLLESKELVEYVNSQSMVEKYFMSTAIINGVYFNIEECDKGFYIRYGNNRQLILKVNERYASNEFLTCYMPYAIYEYKAGHVLVNAQVERELRDSPDPVLKKIYLFGRKPPTESEAFNKYASRVVDAIDYYRITTVSDKIKKILQMRADPYADAKDVSDQYPFPVFYYSQESPKSSSRCTILRWW